MRARRISGSRLVIRSGSRASGIARASRSAIPRRRSAWASNMTPPSELIRPAVKRGGDLLAADRWKAERQKLIVGHGGRGARDPGKKLASATESYAGSRAYATSATLICLRHEIR